MKGPRRVSMRWVREHRGAAMAHQQPASTPRVPAGGCRGCRDKAASDLVREARAAKKPTAEILRLLREQREQRGE